MSHAAPAMSHAAHFADNFPKSWRLKRLLPAPKQLLGAAGAALLKALQLEAGERVCRTSHQSEMLTADWRASEPSTV
jgi:hypothetical protein